MKSRESFANKFVNVLKGKDERKTKNITIPKISTMLERLMSVDDDIWGQYAFRREPLKGKFKSLEKKELVIKANDCGKAEAERIRKEFGNIDIYSVAEKLGLQVDYPDRPNGGRHIIFAQFVEPNKITIFKDSVNKADDIIVKENLDSYFKGVKIEEILLAHEIFHFIEENNNELFTRKEKIRLWKVGPIKNDSNIVCLGEIAGMAFAREILKLSYSPYVLDVFLVYLYSKEAAYALYDEITSIKKEF